MMTDLILDVGNTRVKAALFSGSRMVDRAMWDETGDPGPLLAFMAGRTIDHIGIARSGRLEGGWSEALRRIGDPSLTWLTGASPSPVRSAYRTPDTLGVDRLANAVAGAQLFPGRPTLAIDLGTCVTYDLVDTEGVYHGGIITPGFRMRARAMHEFTARLPEVFPTEDAALIGTDTLSSLASGTYHGLRAELKALIAEFRQQHERLAVVLTGGDAVRFARGLENGIFAHPFLTLFGLHALSLFDRPAAGAPSSRSRR